MPWISQRKIIRKIDLNTRERTNLSTQSLFSLLFLHNKLASESNSDDEKITNFSILLLAYPPFFKSYPEEKRELFFETFLQ